MKHTELHFMIENYMLFASVGLLVAVNLILTIHTIWKIWKGDKK